MDRKSISDDIGKKVNVPLHIMSIKDTILPDGNSQPAPVKFEVQSAAE